MERDDMRNGGVEVPTDLGNALAAEPSARAAWDQLTPQQQRAHIASLEAGEDDLARERCVVRLVRELGVEVPRHSGR